LSKLRKIIYFLSACIFALYGCANESVLERDIATMSTKELILLLENPENPEHLFGAITKELARRGPSASEAAPALSVALTYPRRDSHLAGFALMAMGPDAKTAIPLLVSQLFHTRTSVRRYAALSLGTIGKSAECAVPQLASLLWHQDPETRSAASISIDAITGINLVDPEAKLNPQVPGIMPLDESEGVFSGPAKHWWVNNGQDMNWPTENCEVQQ
jgi:hypothetical protein